MHNNDKSYKGNKRKIQSYFYNKSCTKSNVVGLAGNNLKEYLIDINLILTTKAKAYIYDINPSVIRNFQFLIELNSKLKLINAPIQGCRIERFMDIDLMATYKTTGNIIEFLFKEQLRKYEKISNTKSKTFMFTHCLRKGINTKYIIGYYLTLLQLADKKLISWEEKTYRDGAPMSTVQIIWK